MPDLNFKATYFYKSDDGAGWTENFFLQSANQQSALDLATALPLVNARLAMLGTDYRLGQVRVSNVDSPRDSLIKAYSTAQGRGKAPVDVNKADDPSEEPYDALLIRAYSSPQHWRSLFMRGLPGGVITKSRTYNPSPDFIGKFATWRNLVAPAAGFFRLRTLAWGDDLQPAGILVNVDTRSLTVNMGVALIPALAKNAKIRIRGVTGANGINGEWRIRLLRTNAFVTYPRAGKIYGTPGGDFSISVATPDYQALTSLIPERGVSRKVGRPFDAPVGRAKVRKS